MTSLTLPRRSMLALTAAAAAAPRLALAGTPKQVMWDDLIPPGVPYAEIVGEGVIDFENDSWSPEYDANALKLNEELDGALIRMPGYIIPMDLGSEGVTSFILVPYVGACIHTPPPPPNQLVFVTSQKPWPGDQLWDPVWVTGIMRTQMKTTELAEIGYALTAESMEVYVW